MVRRRKRTQEDRVAGKRNLDLGKASWWKDRLCAAKKQKEGYTEKANAVMRYFTARHGELFSSPSVRSHFMEFNGAAAVSVPKSAQVRNGLGPHLYPTNPRRVITPKTEDGVMIALARTLEAYVNYTPRETRLVRQKRRAIDDALLRGRGFAYTGWDEKREVVTSWYVPSTHVLIDPDVDYMEDATWIAIRKIEPLWRVKNQIKDKWRKRGLKANWATSVDPVDDDLDDEERKKGEPTATNDLLEYWDVYSKMGAGMRGAEFPDGSRHQDEEDFVKISISHDHPVPLFEGPWEIPLYLDADWPLAELDLIETLDQLWPESVMSQVMPLQRTMDLYTSLQLNACKIRGSVRVFVDQELTASNVQRFRNGAISELFVVKRTGQEPLANKVHVVDMGRHLPDIAPERDWLERQFEATTGVSPMVHGADEAGAKDRSATATRVKSEATNTRLGDMKSRTEEWCSIVARHEALAVRLDLDADEVEPYVNTRDIGMYRIEFLLPEKILDVRDELGDPLFEGEEVPVRDTRPAKTKERSKREPPYTLEYISAGSANFFASAEEAIQAMQELLQDLLSLAEVDLRSMYVVSDLAEEGLGFDPESLQSVEDYEALGLSVVPVDVDDVWRATDGISAKELMREFAYELATGSMQKIDRQREQDLVEQEIQQVLPVAMQVGDVSMANAILQHRDDAHEIPHDKRLPPLEPPPPPMPAPAPGGEA